MDATRSKSLIVYGFTLIQIKFGTSLMVSCAANAVNIEEKRPIIEFRLRIRHTDLNSLGLHFMSHNWKWNVGPKKPKHHFCRLLVFVPRNLCVFFFTLTLPFLCVKNHSCNPWIIWQRKIVLLSKAEYWLLFKRESVRTQTLFFSYLSQCNEITKMLYQWIVVRREWIACHWLFVTIWENGLTDPEAVDGIFFVVLSKGMPVQCLLMLSTCP